MTKTELIRELSDITDYTSGGIREVLDALGDVCGYALLNGEDVTIPGIVKLTKKWKKPTKSRMGRNPRTGEQMRFAAKPGAWVVRARILKALKDKAEESKGATRKTKTRKTSSKASTRAKTTKKRRAATKFGW